MQGIVMGAVQMLTQALHNRTNLQNRDNTPIMRHGLPNGLQASSYGARKVLDRIPSRKSIINIVKQDRVKKRPNMASSYFTDRCPYRRYNLAVLLCDLLLAWDLIDQLSCGCVTMVSHIHAFVRVRPLLPREFAQSTAEAVSVYEVNSQESSTLERWSFSTVHSDGVHHLGPKNQSKQGPHRAGV